MTIDSVTGSRSESEVATGFPVIQEEPKSPLAMSASQLPYWTSNGWSSPSSARFAATTSALAFWPTMVRATSCPVIRSIANVSEEITNTSRMPEPIRLSTKESTASSWSVTGWGDYFAGAKL